MTPDLAAMAKRLTKAQREAIDRCWQDGNEIVQGGIDDSGVSTRVINSLLAKSLLAWRAPPDLHMYALWRLNELGLALRKHLMEGRA